MRTAMRNCWLWKPSFSYSFLTEAIFNAHSDLDGKWILWNLKVSIEATLWQLRSCPLVYNYYWVCWPAIITALYGSFVSSEIYINLTTTKTRLSYRSTEYSNSFSVNSVSILFYIHEAEKLNGITKPSNSSFCSIYMWMV